MKTVLIILSLLSFANTQFVLNESKFESLIANLVQSEGSATDVCLGQLKLLSAAAADEKPSWASNSEFWSFQLVVFLIF
jgi:hypothetical protein